MIRGSIRTRLTLTVGVVFAVTASAAALLALRQVDRTVVSNAEESAGVLLDEYLRGLQTGAVGQVDTTGENIPEFVFADAEGSILTANEFGGILISNQTSLIGEDDTVLFELDPDRAPFDVSAVVPETDLVFPDQTFTTDEIITISTLEISVGERVTKVEPDRVLVSAPVAIGSETLSVGVSQPLAEARSGVTALRNLLAVGIPLLTLFVASITWLVIGRSLRPVGAMASRVDQISNESLDQRVPEPDSANELAHLAQTMNAMLGRLQGARDSQHRFISDASHELRSPITATKATIEVARAHPESTDWETTAEVIHQENERLAGLVDDLLLLASLDENPTGALVAPIDLDEVCLGEAERPHPAPVRVQVDGPARVEANLGRLTRAVRNLVDNAARYAASEVVIRVDSVDGFGLIEVTDDGPGIDHEAIEQVFDRFARLDESRNRATGAGAGAGLGLAITRQIVEAAGGTVSATNNAASNNKGAVFTVRLPLVP